MTDRGERSRSFARRAAELAAAILLGGAVVSPAAAGEQGLASPWVTEQASRARLVAGGVQGPSGERVLFAGLEIALEDGWKTYWRNPGSSGVPPRIDWQTSENVDSAELTFPAPTRFKDRDGDTIGYKHAVILPIRLKPKDPARPIVLQVATEFGICREVCVPVQPTLSLTLPADAIAQDADKGLAAAVAKVPRAGTPDAATPRATRIDVRLAGDKPSIAIEAVFPGDSSKGDIFLEAPDGIWIPMTKAAGEGANGARRFVVDLTDGADLKDLAGRDIRATLVGATGQAETSFKMVASP